MMLVKFAICSPSPQQPWEPALHCLCTLAQAASLLLDSSLTQWSCTCCHIDLPEPSCYLRFDHHILGPTHPTKATRQALSTSLNFPHPLCPPCSFSLLCLPFACQLFTGCPERTRGSCWWGVCVCVHACTHTQGKMLGQCHGTVSVSLQSLAWRQ